MSTFENPPTLVPAIPAANSAVSFEIVAVIPSNLFNSVVVISLTEIYH